MSRILTKRWDGIDKSKANELLKLKFERFNLGFTPISQDGRNAVDSSFATLLMKKFPRNIKQYYWVSDEAYVGFRFLVLLEEGYYVFLKFLCQWEDMDDSTLILANDIADYYISKNWDSIILYGMNENDYQIYLKDTVEKKVDFEVLLMKYIGLVGQREGFLFLKNMDKTLFENEEWIALQNCVDNSMKLKEMLEFRDKVDKSDKSDKNF